jgi:FtsZ-interacting cell division protein ZipA
MRDYLIIFIPVVVAIITAIVAPLWLSRRKMSGELNIRLLDEGRDLRRDQAKRIDDLEERLDKAAGSMNSALDQIRELKSRHEQCEVLIANLRAELEKANRKLNARFDAFEAGEHHESV